MYDDNVISRFSIPDENNPDPISLIDAAGKTEYGNASATKLFGYRPEELVGRNFLDLIHSEDRDRSSRMLQEAITNPSDSLQWDARVCGKDGNCSWYEHRLQFIV